MKEKKKKNLQSVLKLFSIISLIHKPELVRYAAVEGIMCRGFVCGWRGTDGEISSTET